MATKKKVTAKTPVAGTRFIKLDAESKKLSADAPQWVQVLDTETNLIWPADASADRMTFAQAKSYAESLKLGGGYWRVPTIKELLSLVDYSRFDPAIDTTFFRCASSWHWSSTVDASSPSVCAWDVNFDCGYSSWSSQGSKFSVRSVRSAGQ